MKTTFLRLITLVSLLALLLSACGPQTTQQTNTPIRVAWSLYPGWYPLVLAQELGYFEKYNVQVELVRFETYDDTAPQLAAGLVDAAALVLGDVLLEDVGNSSTVVLITDNSEGADQLLATREIMTSRNLRGARIGFSTGTFGELLVLEMLTANGVQFSDVQLVEVPPEGVADALGDTIDVGHTFEPFASQARAKGNGILFTSADAPGIIVDTIAFTNTFIENRPNDVRNFINAWFEAVEYWQENPAEGNAIIAAATGQSVEDVSFEGIRFFSREDNLAAFQPGTDTSSIYYTAQYEMDFLVSTGVVTNPLNVDDLLTPEFLR